MIQAYTRCHGFKLYAKKALMVSIRQAKTRGDYTIQIVNKMIQPSKDAKFLGATFERNLSWKAQVKSHITKARHAISIVTLLRGETWVTPKSTIHLTGALVPFHLMYEHEAYCTISDKQWLDLERAEMAALKAALGLQIYALNDLIYQEVGWLPLREESRLRCAHFKAR